MAPLAVALTACSLFLGTLARDALTPIEVETQRAHEWLTKMEKEPWLKKRVFLSMANMSIPVFHAIDDAVVKFQQDVDDISWDWMDKMLVNLSASEDFGHTLVGVGKDMLKVKSLVDDAEQVTGKAGKELQTMQTVVMHMQGKETQNKAGPDPELQAKWKAAAAAGNKWESQMTKVVQGAEKADKVLSLASNVKGALGDKLFAQLEETDKLLQEKAHNFEDRTKHWTQMLGAWSDAVANLTKESTGPAFYGVSVDVPAMEAAQRKLAADGLSLTSGFVEDYHAALKRTPQTKAKESRAFVEGLEKAVTVVKTAHDEVVGGMKDAHDGLVGMHNQVVDAVKTAKDNVAHTVADMHNNITHAMEDAEQKAYNAAVAVQKKAADAAKETMAKVAYATKDVRATMAAVKSAKDKMSAKLQDVRVNMQARRLLRRSRR